MSYVDPQMMEMIQSQMAGPIDKAGQKVDLEEKRKARNYDFEGQSMDNVAPDPYFLLLSPEERRRRRQQEQDRGYPALNSLSHHWGY